MYNSIIAFLLIPILLGYAYLCFFKPKKLEWVTTSPMSGNCHPAILKLHGSVCLVMVFSIVILLIFGAKP